MDSTASLMVSLITLVMHLQVQCSAQTVIAKYGATIEVPCNNGAAMPTDLIFTKWKYEKDDGTPGDLLVKAAHKEEATVQATDGYKTRVSITANYSLLISQGSLSEQRTFTCMVVSSSNLDEYSVNVQVHKKPSLPQIQDKAKELENTKLTALGVCVVKDANPAANITWSKNGEPLVADGKTIIVSSNVKVDPVTGLSSTTSSLQYAAVKADVGAHFTCSSKYLQDLLVSPPETFTIHYPTEKVSLLVQATGPIKEGDNVTLRCKADGNPPPTSFDFSIKGQKVTVKDKDTYILTGVTRNSAGEYKCSLLGDNNIEASEKLVVSYLDLSLTPSGTVLKTVGHTLEVTMEKNSSGDAEVSWTKDNAKLEKAPTFGQLTYADSGVYVCEVVVAGIKRSKSFQLVVEGIPVITRLTKQRSEDGQHKVLTCEAMGAPQPAVLWSVNGTEEQSSYLNGKAVHKITVVPTGNLTVTCTATNKLGEDVMVINVSALFNKETSEKGTQDDDDDRAKLIVWIVVGLLIAAAVVGLVYWLYMKKTRQGTWKTNEKEAGTSEESKKLEENNHKPEV
ncbi:CD166 antigen homolog isoform X1 [Osmerus eperlanus]|uniref:CD166 antigen homolog isoform X1 n=1 Tax=Osmerus eperlanus TaxID=29151 RepID=UPI002E0D7501